MATDKNEIDKNFNGLLDKGWYTNVNFNLIAFYKLEGKAYLLVKGEIFKVDDRLQMSLKRRYLRPFKVNQLRICKNEIEISFCYIPNQSFFQKYDNTLGYDDEDLDLLSKVFVLANDRERLEDFIRNF